MTAATWVEGAAGSLFDVDNLPWGVFFHGTDEPRVGVRIGDLVLDVAPVAAAEMLDVHHVFQESSLNALMAEGRRVRESLRTWLTGLLTDGTERDLVEPHLGAAHRRRPPPADRGSRLRRLLRLPRPRLERREDLPPGRRAAAAQLAPPARRLPRPRRHRRRQRYAGDAPERAAQGPEGGGHRPTGPRAGSTSRRSSASSSARPRRSAPRSRPTRSPTTMLASGSWGSTTGAPATSRPGSTSRSARSSASRSRPRSPTGSPRSRRSAPPGARCPARTRKPLDYLAPGRTQGLDIAVEVELGGEVVSRPAYDTMYWSPAQMLAHLTVNGASLRTGDLYGSGTISGPERDQRGSLLELSWGGTEPFSTAGGARTFLEDGDTVTLRYTAPGTAGGGSRSARSPGPSAPPTRADLRVCSDALAVAEPGVHEGLPAAHRLDRTRVHPAQVGEGALAVAQDLHDPEDPEDVLRYQRDPEVVEVVGPHPARWNLRAGRGRPRPGPWSAVRPRNRRC